MNKNIQHIKLFNKFLYCVRKYKTVLLGGSDFIAFKTYVFDTYIFYFDLLDFCFELHYIDIYMNLFQKIILAIKFPEQYLKRCE